MKEFLDTSEVSAKCRRCGETKSVRVVSSLKRMVEARGMLCDPCAELEWRESKPKVAKAYDAPKSDPHAPWRRVCPKEFLTIEEGGELKPDGFKVLFHEIPNDSLVWIHGATGATKTASSWRLMRLHFDLGRTVNAFRQLRFGTAYQDAGGRYQTDQWIAALCDENSVLFIDDIGKAQWSKGAFGAFWEILDTRCSYGYQTVITANNSPTVTQQMWVQHENSKEIAAPIMRRLFKGMTIHAK